MAENKLNLEKREVTGKKLKDLRDKGMIPSVVYGGKEPVLLASEYVPTEKVLQKAGYHSPIDLVVDGKKKLAIVKNVDIDPVSRKILNIEFQAISAKEAVVTTTPIVVIGFEESEASRTYHLVLTRSIEEVDVKAKPADLPKELILDASKMETLEDKLLLSDIRLPEGVEYADKELDLEQVAVSLYDPAAEAEKREAEEVVEETAGEAVDDEAVSQDSADKGDGTSEKTEESAE